MRITISTIFFLAVFFSSCKKTTTPDPVPSPAPVDTLVKGADISWLTQMENAGVKFYNSNGQQQECMSLLRSLGVNTIRLRAWVAPANGWNNTADVLNKALRAKNLGMRIMIDIHYSDTWADPGHQTKPAAWSSFGFTGLKTAMADYTAGLMNALRSNGITPEWVQVGNETNDGMLWPDGKASTNMNNFAQLINAGYDAVKSVFPNAKVIVHLSNGNDNSLFRWLFDGLKNNGGKWDVIGMSLYPPPADWATYTALCYNNMTDMIARYNTPVMICEVGMSWDQSAACKGFLSDMISKVRGLPGGKGLGVLYWEPQCYNNWQGYTLGAFDNSGKPTQALSAFN